MIKLVKINHRIRYPPFDSSKLDADKIPIVEHSFAIDGPVVPPFRLGKENSWLVERTVEGEYETDSEYHGQVPQIIKKQRTGSVSYTHLRAHET